MTRLMRRGALIAAAFACAALLLPAGASAQQKVLKFIAQADLRILDPISTTA